MLMEKNLKTFVKCSLKIFIDYLISLLAFAIFFMAVVSLAKDNTGKWMSVYSFVIFLILFSIIYYDMKDIAIKEKRPQYNINPSPYKGVLYGLAGILPILIPILVYPFLQISELIKLRFLQGYTAPLYWFTRLFGDAYWSFIMALFILPFIALLGYLSGHLNVEVLAGLKKYIKAIYSRLKTKEDDEDEFH